MAFKDQQCIRNIPHQCPTGSLCPTQAPPTGVKLARPVQLHPPMLKARYPEICLYCLDRKHVFRISMRKTAHLKIIPSLWRMLILPINVSLIARFSVCTVLRAWVWVTQGLYLREEYSFALTYCFFWLWLKGDQSSDFLLRNRYHVPPPPLPSAKDHFLLMTFEEMGFVCYLWLSLKENVWQTTHLPH